MAEERSVRLRFEQAIYCLTQEGDGGVGRSVYAMGVAPSVSFG
jgi:hypothetical protein